MVPLRKVDAGSWRGVPSRAGQLAAASADSSPASRSAAGLPGSVVPNLTMLLHSALLSGVAGYVDAAGFVLLLGVFPAHLTGELVSDAIAASSGQLATRTARLWLFPIFMASIAVAAVVARALRRRGHKALTGLLALVTVSLAVFASGDALAWLLHESRLPLVLSGGSAVAAMGFQTAMMRESLTGSCPTTVMTGNLAQVIMDLVDHALCHISRLPARGTLPRWRLLSITSALFSFAACAVLGGALTRHWGSLSVSLPALVTAALTLRALHDDRRRGEPPSEAGSELACVEAEEIWPEPSAPSAPSASDETDAASATRIKAGRAVPVEAPQPAPRSVSGTRLAMKPPSGEV